MNIKHIRVMSPGTVAKKLCRILVTAGGLTVLCVLPVKAAVVPGDQFTSTFTETSGPDAGLTGAATFTVGAPAGSDFFNISDFSVTVSTDLCLSCGLLSKDFSSVLFDAATFDLKGNITGTFQESEGNLHTFNLALTNPPRTWTFTDVPRTGRAH